MNKKALFLVVLLAFATGLMAQETALGGTIASEDYRRSLNSATARLGSSSLPSSADMTRFFPVPGYQGQQNSCVGWASAYAIKTYHENVERQWGTGTDETRFSPNYIYNQINGGRDQGSYLHDAAELIVSKGVATWATFPPTSDYRLQPGADAHRDAGQYKGASYQRLAVDNITALKSVLADGNPILFGMYVYENFMNYNGGVYRQSSGSNVGGHAMTLIGYDDSKNAFKLINSWSTNWGDGGYGWVDYDTFSELTMDAYVIYDEVSTPGPTNTLTSPTDISASDQSYTDQIKIIWDEVPGADFYEVFRSDRPNTGFVMLSQSQGTVYYDVGLSLGSEFYYSVRAVNGSGESDFSPISRGRTQDRQTRIGKPQNLRGTHEDGSILLLWDFVDNASGYNVYRWNADRERYARVGLSRDTGFRLSVSTDTTRNETFIVTALNGEQESSASDAYAILVEEDVLDWLDTPVMSASQGEYRDRIVLNWNRISGAREYYVYRWNSVSSEWDELGVVTGTEFVDRNITNDISAYYSLIAVAGEIQSYPADYVMGYVDYYNPRRRKPNAYGDATYFAQENQSIEEEVEQSDSFFSGDDFFDGDQFFQDFDEESFFYMDEEAFFAIDEEAFFSVPENFFGSSADFFGDSSDFF